MLRFLLSHAYADTCERARALRHLVIARIAWSASGVLYPLDLASRFASAALIATALTNPRSSAEIIAEAPGLADALDRCANCG